MPLPAPHVDILWSCGAEPHRRGQCPWALPAPAAQQRLTLTRPCCPLWQFEPEYRKEQQRVTQGDNIVVGGQTLLICCSRTHCR